jgi:hypothetical protein
MYSVMFPEFNENDSPNQKNNYFVSGYMSFNFPDNSSSKPTSLNSLSMLSSSVLSPYKSEQHLDSTTVFPLLSSLSSVLSHPPKVDSSCTNSEFEKLLLHFAYRSSIPLTSLLSFSNNTTNSPTVSKQFKAFHQLSVHIFSSPFSFFYSLH